MTALLAEVCRRAAAADASALVTCDEVEAWPPDVRAALTAAQIVTPSTNATAVLCDACEDGHVEIPEVATLTATGVERAYIPCPSYGRVAVDRRRLERWRCDAGAIAGTLGRLLQARECTSFYGTGWRLGLIPIAGATWQTVVLATPDATTPEKLRRFTRPLVLAMDDTFDTDGVLVLTAARVLRVVDGALACDWRHLEEACGSAALAVAVPTSSSAREPTTRGRPAGTGLGVLLDCWTTCHSLHASFLSMHDFYVAAERYLRAHPEILSPLPPRASFSARRSEGKATRNRLGRCTWKACATPPTPSDLISD